MTVGTCVNMKIECRIIMLSVEIGEYVEESMYTMKITSKPDDINYLKNHTIKNIRIFHLERNLQ